MAYEPEKDITIWRAPDSPEGTILEIKSYNNGEAKVSLTQNTNYGLKPVYRLSLQDFQYIGENWNQIKNVIQQFNSNRQSK